MVTQTPIEAKPSVETRAQADLDLLQHIAIHVPCSASGQHCRVNLWDVLMSARHGASRLSLSHETEGSPLTYAALADNDAAGALQTV